MIRKTIHVANSAIVFWVMVLPVIVLSFLPGSWWFESRLLTISDVEYGDSPVVLENRAVHIPFDGGYDTITYDAETNLPTECRGSERFRYGNLLDGTRSMDLVRWTANNPACSTLSPGVYYTRVCRTITTPIPALYWLIGPKENCNVSNIFRVNEK